MDGGSGGGEVRFPLPNGLPSAPTPDPTGTGTLSLSVEWVEILGDVEDDIAFAVSVGGDGRVGCAGSFRETMEFVADFAFGGVSSTSAGEEDVFVAVFDTSDGAFVWRDVAGGIASDVALALALHPDGRTAVGGRFESASIDFGSGALNASGGADSFIQTFSAGGQPGWGTGPVSNLRDEIHTLAWVDAVFSGGDAEVTANDTDSFAKRRDAANGTVLGQVDNTESAADEFLRAVASDPEGGNWAGVGFFTGTGIYDGQSYTALGEDAIAWHCVIGVGCIDWVLRIGGAMNERATAIAFSPDGDWLIAGWFEGTATAGSTMLTSAGNADLFVVRVNPGGTVQWAVRAGGAGNDRPTGIGVGADGRIHVAGQYDGAFHPGVPLDPLPSASVGSFLLVLDESGAPASAVAVGGEGVEVHGLAVSEAGDAYLTGAYSGSVDFGRGPETSAGGRDVFLLRGRMQ